MPSFESSPRNDATELVKLKWYKMEKFKALFKLGRKSHNKMIGTLPSSPPAEPTEAVATPTMSIPVKALFPVSISHPKRPALRIDTGTPTSPSTPQSIHESPEASSSSTITFSSYRRRHSFPNSLRTSSSSSTNSTAQSSPLRKSSLTSLSFLKTPRQRRLQEIRQGKLPATMSDNVNELDSQDENELLPEDIYDPSSSTTYNPENRHKNGSKISQASHMHLPSFVRRPLTLT